MKTQHALSLFAWPALLAGCTTNSAEYPSLSVRDAERAEMSYLPSGGDADMPAPAPLPDSLTDQLAALREEARSAHSAFMDAAPGAERTVKAARGATMGSRRWGDAQIAMADLDSLRSRAAVALSDLDLLYANASVDFVERTAISEARNTIVAIVSEEDTILARLRRQF